MTPIPVPQPRVAPETEALRFYLDPQFPEGERGHLPVAYLFRGSTNYLGELREEGRDPGADRILAEVQALSAQWLQLQHVSVLLGAGASFYASKVLGRDLLEKTREALSGRPTLEVLDRLVELAPDRETVAAQFEAFLSQVAALRSLLDAERGPLTKMASEGLASGLTLESLNALVTDLERAIIRIFDVPLPPSPFADEEQSADDASITPHEALVARLVARDPQASRPAIFTTNYDTLLEQALDRLGIIYSDGFVGTVQRRFAPASYSIDHYYPGEVTEGRVQRYDRVAHLYKLHGSITWQRSTMSTATNPFAVEFVPRRGVQVSNSLDEMLPEGKGLAILPTAAKYGETLAMPFAHLFRAFHEIVARPQTVLFVIGYSGWDEHINAIIRDGLANPTFTVVIVDPLPSSWARRLLHSDVSGRIYCFGGEWGRVEEFVMSVLPDLEVLKAQQKVAATLRRLSRTSAPDRRTAELDDVGSEGE